MEEELQFATLWEDLPRIKDGLWKGSLLPWKGHLHPMCVSFLWCLYLCGHSWVMCFTFTDKNAWDRRNFIFQIWYYFLKNLFFMMMEIEPRAIHLQDRHSPPPSPLSYNPGLLSLFFKNWIKLWQAWWLTNVTLASGRLRHDDHHHQFKAGLVT